MAVNVEMWKPEIVEALFDSNEFITRGTDANEYVVGGRIVHIPNSGGPSAVQINRSVYPATIGNRADTDVLYALDELTSDPRRISDIEKNELSYSKRQSIISEDTGNMQELAGYLMAYNWLKDTTFTVQTTGTAVATTLAGTTGNRKAVTKKDFLTAATLFNTQKVPQKDRVAVITPAMLAELALEDTTFAWAMQQLLDHKKLEMPKCYGFDVYVNAIVAKQDTGGTLKLPTAATAVTDNEVGMFFQKSSVEYAIGEVAIFDNPDRAEYYGDLISFLLRMGGRARRADLKGIARFVKVP